MTWDDLDAEAKQKIVAHALMGVSVVIGDGQITLRDYLGLLRGPSPILVIHDIARRAVETMDELT